MSLMSSDIKLGLDVDPSIRRWQAASTRDLEQLYLLLTQGLGGFSNESPGSISQDPLTNGMGVEANQGDYTFSGPASLAQLADAAAPVNLTGFLRSANNLSDVDSVPGALYNLGAIPFTNWGSATVYSTPGSFTHTWTVGKVLALVSINGAGGGGGGGSAAVASNSGAGGGAGGGERIIMVMRISGLTTGGVVGSHGAGGAFSATLGNGIAGGFSSFNGVVAGGGEYGFGWAAGAGVGGLGGSSFSSISSAAGSMALRFPGKNGDGGAVINVVYSGAGAVTQVQWRAGRGGRGVTGDFGDGGDGGGASVNGTDGNNGAVFIYEL